MPPTNLRSMVAQGGRWVGSRRNCSSSSSSAGSNQPGEPLDMFSLIFGNALLGYGVYLGSEFVSLLTVRRRILRAMEEEESQLHDEVASKAA